jgi:4-diphosphocytidyl-2-C-methyl-D-erythritol kinase
MAKQFALAPAKINLTLRIFGQRADGYHELESVVALLDFGDRISIRTAADPGIELVCSNTTLPTGRHNLAYRAAEMLAEAVGREPHLKINLLKRVPAGAGLGGGSSDAAETLRLLNELWELDWPLEKLAELGAELGSDVPVFVHGRHAVMRGRGERVEPGFALPGVSVILMLPTFACTTARVYAATDASTLPERSTTLDELQSAANARTLSALLFNDLEPAATSAYPEVGVLLAGLAERLGRRVHLTGSGSGLFALADSEEEADELVQRIAHVPSLEHVVVTRLLATAS